MEGYLGQVHRSRSYVKCQGHEVKKKVHWDVSLKRKTQDYDAGCFQRYFLSKQIRQITSY